MLANCHYTFGREMSRVRCCVLSDRLSSRRQPARENCQTSHLLFHRNDTLTIYHISSDTLYSYNYSFSRIIIIVEDDFHHHESKKLIGCMVALRYSCDPLSLNNTLTVLAHTPTSTTTTTSAEWRLPDDGGILIWGRRIWRDPRWPSKAAASGKAQLSEAARAVYPISQNPSSSSIINSK